MTSLDEVATELAPKIGEAVSVVVLRKQDDAGLEYRKLALAESAANSFRELCHDAQESLTTRTLLQYGADAELGSSEAFMLEDAASLAELSDLRDLAINAATLPIAAPRNLDLAIQSYAVVVGDHDRILLMRRANPQMSYASGRWLAVAGEQLRRLEDQAFSFAPGFDIILSDRWVVVLNQNAFEKLFREMGIVDEHISSWIGGITDYLPMKAESLEELRNVAKRDSRTWRRHLRFSSRGRLRRAHF